MDRALALIEKLNSIAAALSPGAPLAGLALGMAGFIGRIVEDMRKRKQAGEDVTDLLAAIAEFGDAVDALQAANDEYWTIPEKPVDGPSI